ncbi:hypothetical protein MMC07_001984 [Pseudocyphellaria aurata]|nr:hypothetical protein [Pseudocyphellaria aurata]
MASSRIVALASIITSNTAQVNDYLSSHGLPAPSFDPNVPPSFLEEKPIVACRQAILEATDELHALMLGPAGVIFPPVHNHYTSLQAIYRFDLANIIQDEASYDEISQASGLKESDLRRILRHSMTNHIFREPRKGIVAHTAASKLLADSPNLRDELGVVTEELWPSAARTVDAMIKWPGSQEPNHSGFNLANDTEDSVFRELAKHPARQKRFADSMRWSTTNPEYDSIHIINNYPWKSFGDGTIVDVGGSHGAVSVAIAQRFQSLRCIVQDLPDVVADAEKTLPPSLVDRVTFMEHDFFKEQPVQGADVYYFRWILHDWSDKYAIRILRCLIPALKVGARIVLSEYVMPEPGEVSLYQERFLRWNDLCMLELHNAKERDKNDWAKLFQEADSRFIFVGVKQPVQSKLSIIEAVWMLN